MAEPTIVQVVLMGMITVFAALLVLIVMIKIMSSIINSFVKSSIEESETSVAKSSEGTSEFIKDQPTKVAIAVAIAEEMNDDVSHIRIKSIKKL